MTSEATPMGGGADSNTLLQMTGIAKRFRSVAALSDGNMSVQRGKIQALIGQNGAGKSTLIKILTGVYRRDSGETIFEGAPVDFRSTGEAQQGGIVTIYQEVNLIPYLSVAENVFIGRFPRRGVALDWAAMNAGAKRVLEPLSLDIDVTKPLGSYRVATQQLIAIARAVSLDARLLVLDEPTSSLADKEVDILFDVMRSLKAQDVSMVFVSHRLDELYEICDDVTVLRDGYTVMQRPLEGLSQYDLVTSMLGREAETLAGGAREVARTATSNVPALTVEAAASAPRLRNASISVLPGQVQGVAGLLGSGRSELLRCVFGGDPLDSGVVTVNGTQVTIKTPRDAVSHGLAFLSEDRRSEGIIPQLSVRENLTLAMMPNLTKRGIVDRRRQREIVANYIERIGIKADADQPIAELSGGNQQKVLLARWLATDPVCLLLDEPTRGIDVSAKADILKLISELAAQGKGVVLVSSELEEIVSACDAVTVLRDGVSVARINLESLSEQALITAMAAGGITEGKTDS